MRTHSTNVPKASTTGNGRRDRALAWLALLALTLVLSSCGRQPLGDVLGTALELEVGIVVLSRSAAQDVGHRPLNGATVADTVTVMATANHHVTSIAFHVNDPYGERAPVAVSEELPFVFELDTTALGNGAHDLSVFAIVGATRTKPATAHFEVQNAIDDGDETQNPINDEPGDHDPIDDDSEVWNPIDDEATFQPGTPGSAWPFHAVPPATLYVSPHGSDANDGRSPDRPLRTVQRAANIVRPGDVVYLRGGVYPIQVGFNTSGTPSQPIVWTSFPGEWAILDGSDQVPVESGHRVWVTNVSWNVFMNFEVRNSPREGIWISNSHDNVFRNLITHGNHYSGITNSMSNRNRFEYIVTYDNFDRFNPWGRPGDDADGISIHTGDGNVVYRVVAFFNSDDGIDAWRSTNTVIDSSISFANGRGSHGNGNGIKAGGNFEANRTIVRNSLSFDNRSHGFDHNSGRFVTFVNNTSIGNGGYDFVADATTTLHNNLAAGGRLSIGSATASHNNWNLGIGNAQFVSVNRDDPAFLSLASTSPAIDAGRDVGLPFTGSAPDLGALAFGERHGQLIAPMDLAGIVARSGVLGQVAVATSSVSGF